MEIILLENILNLGSIGDKVRVKNGYGRNFLLKQGKALRFNKDNQNFVDKKKDELNKKNFDNLVKMEKELEKKKKSIDASKNISTKENLEKEISLFNQDIKKFRTEKDKILKNFEIKKKNEIDNFLIRVNPLIQEYMKDNSISIVLSKNQIFMGNVEMDITSDIIELVNNNVK